MELLRIDSDIDHLIASRASARDLKNVAREKNFNTLAVDGIRRVLDGTTTLTEVSRVIDLSDA